MKKSKKTWILFLTWFLAVASLPLPADAAQPNPDRAGAAVYSENLAVFSADSAGPSLNKSSLSLAVGESSKLKITGTAAKSWKSSNKKVAVVNAKGKVTAKKAGTAVITCKGKDGRSYRCEVTVGKASPAEELKPDPAKVYKAIMAQKKKYPEGMHWTNDDYYEWKGGGGYLGGYGCAAFAFRMSDVAFGSRPTYIHKKFSNIRVGDIIRLDYDTHSVIVLEVKDKSVVVAEGNYNSSIHWGREIPRSEIRATGVYVMTRYEK